MSKAKVVPRVGNRLSYVRAIITDINLNNPGITYCICFILLYKQVAGNYVYMKVTGAEKVLASF